MCLALLCVDEGSGQLQEDWSNGSNGSDMHKYAHATSAHPWSTSVQLIWSMPYFAVMCLRTLETLHAVSHAFHDALHVHVFMCGLCHLHAGAPELRGSIVKV